MTRRGLTSIYVDADACPVREEVYRVAGRLKVGVYVVSNGSRPIRPPGLPFVQRGDGRRCNGRGRRLDRRAHYRRRYLRHVSDIPLASRCLAKGARVVPPTGRPFTAANIGNALAGRELSRHLRELGAGGGPPPFTKADRSRFLSALDTAVQAALRTPPAATP